MGFGYLFCGFLISLNPVYSGFSGWLGYTLMLLGLLPLSRCNCGFGTAKRLGFVGLGVSIAVLVANGLDLLGVFDYQSSALYQILGLVEMLLLIVFRSATFFGCYQLASELKVIKLMGRALYALVVHLAVFVFNFLLTVRILPASSTAFTVVLLAGLVAGLVGAFLFFGCYRIIGYEGEDTSVPASPFDKWKKEK